MATARWIFSAGLACALVHGLAFGLRGDEEEKPAALGYGSTTTPYSPSAGPAIESGAVPAASAVPVGPGNPGGMPPKPETSGPPSAKPEDAKTKEPIKPITRPPAPATSPNPEAFKVRPDNKTGKIRLNFKGQPWQPVLEWLATISGKSLDWQELPGDSLNISTQRSYTVPEVRDLINGLLLARGYTLLCRGEVLTVAEIKKIDPSLVPRVEPADLANRDPHEYVKVSFPLLSLVAGTVADELKPMLSPNGRLNSLNETNRLEVMDAVTNLRDVAAVLKQQQSDGNQPRSFCEFKLKHARAEEVHKVLSTLLGVDSPKSPPGGEQPGNMNPEQAMMMAQAQAGNSPGGGGKSPGGASPKPKGAVSLAVNARNNSILVQAPPDKMAVIAQVIDAVDIPVDRSGSLLANLDRTQVYRLSGIDPEPVVKTLMEIGNLEPATRLEVDKKNSAIIAYASLVDHVTIRAVVDKLSGSERKFEVIRLRRLAAERVAGTIDFMMGSGKKEKSRSRSYFGSFESPGGESAESSKQFRVDADVEHNRLLLWANPVEVAEVEALLTKLGEIPASESGFRVIDVGDAKETQELIERIRSAWPRVAPNALSAPAAVPPPEESKEPTRSLPVLPKDSSTTSLWPRPLPDPAAGQARATFFHLADMRQELANGSSAGSLSAGSLSAGSLSAGSLPGEGAADQRPPANARPAPPPVKITIGPDGKLILSSQDAQALDRLEELAAELTTSRKEYHVFRLKYASAIGVAMNLEDFFKENKKERPRMPWWYYDYGDSDSSSDSQDDRRLSRRRKLTFISDFESNTILVGGASAEQLRTIEDLIRLYDQPPPHDAQSARRTEIIHLKYSKAKAVADTVKDVYRDLLSANDKALADSKRDSGRTLVFEYGDGGSDKGETKTPKFKGLLSIGVDDVSNSLMVSAPGYLFDHVAKMIKGLDEAAASNYTVGMVRISGKTGAKRMKGILDEIFLHKSGAASPAAKPAKPAKGAKSAKQAAGGSAEAGSGESEESP